MNINDLDTLWSLLLDYKNSDLLASPEDRNTVQTVLTMVTASNEVAHAKERARLAGAGDDYDASESSSSDY